MGATFFLKFCRLTIFYALPKRPNALNELSLPHRRRRRHLIYPIVIYYNSTANDDFLLSFMFCFLIVHSSSDYFFFSPLLMSHRAIMSFLSLDLFNCIQLTISTQQLKSLWLNIWFCWCLIFFLHLFSSLFICCVECKYQLKHFNLSAKYKLTELTCTLMSVKGVEEFYRISFLSVLFIDCSSYSVARLFTKKIYYIQMSSC